MTDNGRRSCCFNLRRTACLCVTTRGDLGGVIEDCVFSRAVLNATPIAGPCLAERGKMERYRRCRSAAASTATTVDTTVTCAPRTPRTRRDELMTPQRVHRRRPGTAASRLADVTVMSDRKVDEPAGIRVNSVAEIVPRLYRTYGFQFTSSYRPPVVVQLLTSPATSRPAGVDLSDDSATAAESGLPQQARRGDRTSIRSVKRGTSSSPTRRNRTASPK